MPTEVLEIRACRACAVAKRRCGKQKPHCLRCRKRGVECGYPPPKPSSFVLCGGDDASPPAYEIMAPSSQAWIEDSSLGQARMSLESAPWIGVPKFWWFAAPSTWEIEHQRRTDMDRIYTIDLKRNLGRVHHWLARWVDEGGNPFIHPQLYRHRFPQSIQDAYTALSCYLRRNTANEMMIFRIIEDRATKLVEEDTNSASLDTLEHLARVQALFIYQLIGFQDSDARLRHISETHMPVLRAWCYQMVESASQEACLGTCVVLSRSDPSIAAVDFSSSSKNLWFAWILAESIRRTWLMVSGIQGVYEMVQKASAHCMGAMVLTTRVGFWEASTSLAWEKKCSEAYGGLVKMNEAGALLAHVGIEDINEFTKLALELTHGSEQMERWGFDIAD